LLTYLEFVILIFSINSWSHSLWSLIDQRLFFAFTLSCMMLNTSVGIEGAINIVSWVYIIQCTICVEGIERWLWNHHDNTKQWKHGLKHWPPLNHLDLEILTPIEGNHERALSFMPYWNLGSSWTIDPLVVSTILGTFGLGAHSNNASNSCLTHEVLWFNALPISPCMCF
jgi:hypothetical protein